MGDITYDVTLRWVAASDADVDTDYAIYADETTPGTFAEVSAGENATNRGDGSYFPYSTTLDGGLTATITTVALTGDDVAQFAENDYIVVDKEMIKLGSEVADTFSNCTRGVGGTIPETHDTGATVYEVHESYTHSSAKFGTDESPRYVLRYCIKRKQGSDYSIGTELVAVNPPAPPFTNMCTVWGLIEELDADAKSGVTVQMTIADTDNYGPDTGETIYKEVLSTTTDSDGFFYFYVRRDVAREATTGSRDTITITISSGTSAELAWSVTSVPDQDNINFLRT